VLPTLSGACALIDEIRTRQGHPVVHTISTAANATAMCPQALACITARHPLAIPANAPVDAPLVACIIGSSSRMHSCTMAGKLHAHTPGIPCPLPTASTAPAGAPINGDAGSVHRRDRCCAGKEHQMLTACAAARVPSPSCMRGETDVEFARRPVCACTRTWAWHRMLALWGCLVPASTRQRHNGGPGQVLRLRCLTRSCCWESAISHMYRMCNLLASRDRELVSAGR
jgi:hypothetical protein